MPRTFESGYPKPFLKQNDMIEVEKKFHLDDQGLARIKKEGIFFKKKSFTDTYYDTSEYVLTLKNMWLRKREDSFELKIGLATKRENIDRFYEITKPEEISSILHLPAQEPLEKELPLHGLFPFCSYTTMRETYHLHDLRIDIDLVDFGEMVYQLAECEVIAPSKEEMRDAEKKIEQFLQNYHIPSEQPASGKVAIFLALKRKEHYQALLQAGVLRAIPQNILSFLHHRKPSEKKATS